MPTIQWLDVTKYTLSRERSIEGRLIQKTESSLLTSDSGDFFWLEVNLFCVKYYGRYW